MKNRDHVKIAPERKEKKTQKLKHKHLMATTVGVQQQGIIYIVTENLLLLFVYVYLQPVSTPTSTLPPGEQAQRNSHPNQCSNSHPTQSLDKNRTYSYT